MLGSGARHPGRLCGPSHARRTRARTPSAQPAGAGPRGQLPGDTSGLGTPVGSREKNQPDGPLLEGAEASDRLAGVHVQRHSPQEGRDADAATAVAHGKTETAGWDVPTGGRRHIKRGSSAHVSLGSDTPKPNLTAQFWEERQRGSRYCEPCV